MNYPVVIKPSNIPVCRFTDSLIAGNTRFLAVPDTTRGLKRFTGKEICQESNLIKSGSVLLSEVKTEGMQKIT